MKMNKKTCLHVTFAQIDLRAVEHNLDQIRKLALRNQFKIATRPPQKKVPPVELLTVVKADAYGHGAEQIVRLLDKRGVNSFAVSDVKEGVHLRGWGVKKTILLLESPLPSFAKMITDHNLTPTVCTLELAEELNNYARKIRKNISIHVKVDTGMGRLGVWHKEAFDFIRRINRHYQRLTVDGIYTHFPSADTDRKFTREQIQNLYQLVLKLDRCGIVIPYIHAANSMGLAGYETKVLNLVRPGLMLYGLYPTEQLKKKISLMPAMSVYSRIIFLKTIEKGRSISYGRTFIASRRMTVATIPIGYNDGYLRAFSGRTNVLVKGKRCPVIGRVTMDQIIIDVSRVPGIKLGDPVVILGQSQDQNISADELADRAGTINYEIVCSLGNRLPRQYR